MNNIILMGIGALILPLVIASSFQVLNGEDEAKELEASASERGARFLVNAIVKSTTTTTSTTTSTVSTVQFCVKKNYACGGKRRKRRDEPVINEAQYDQEMERALEFIEDADKRNLVKREAKTYGVNLARVGGFSWIPTPVQEAHDEEEIEQPIVEKRSAPEEDEATRKARFFNLITILGTVSTTSTSYTTSTIGTVAISGTTSQCPSGSITNYLTLCG